jgi:hypothetical protein
MIYSAGRDCPVCGDAGEIIFLKSVASGQIFFTCYACHCACDTLPLEDCGCDEPRNLAPNGYALATLEDVERAGLSSFVADELSEENLLFYGEEGFVAPERNPQDYDGKTVAVYLAVPLPNGEKDWSVLFGKLRFESGKLMLDVDSEPTRVEILREWLCRITPQYSKVFPYCEAELSLSLALRAFPNDTPPDELIEMAKRRNARSSL